MSWFNRKKETPVHDRIEPVLSLDAAPGARRKRLEQGGCPGCGRLLGGKVAPLVRGQKECVVCLRPLKMAVNYEKELTRFQRTVRGKCDTLTVSPITAPGADTPVGYVFTDLIAQRMWDGWIACVEDIFK